MSTKIYYAYRIPLNKLNDFIDKTRQQVFKFMAKKIVNLMEPDKIEDKDIPDCIKPERINIYKKR